MKKTIFTIMACTSIFVLINIFVFETHKPRPKEGTYIPEIECVDVKGANASDRIEFLASCRSVRDKELCLYLEAANRIRKNDRINCFSLIHSDYKATTRDEIMAEITGITKK